MSVGEARRTLEGRRREITKTSDVKEKVTSGFKRRRQTVVTIVFIRNKTKQSDFWMEKKEFLD